MYILGLNAYHGDSAACIYKDGVLIAASEEERFRRIKHWAGLPTQAINFCLLEGKVSLKEIDYITVSRDPMAKMGKKIWHILANPPKIATLKNRAANSFNIKSLKQDIANSFGFPETDLKAKVIYVEHHRSHLASSFHVSPFEQSAILSVDGMGDFTSTMRAVGAGSNIKVLDSVSYPHSIGYLYTAFTQYLGFPNYGDEYKVMGLSPYGKPTLLNKLRKVVNIKKDGRFELVPKYFAHFEKGISMSWEGGKPIIEPIFGRGITQLFGPPRLKEAPLTDYHKDLAASVQRLTEEMIFQLAENLYQKTKIKNLCLTGGCAQNSVANGKIIANTSFENLFVPPAGHDAGTAIGSALYHYHQNLGFPRNSFQEQAFTGAKFSNVLIEKTLQEKGVAYHKYSSKELLETVSDCLMEGGVVGWFQGRAEFGPRALGNRSILVDPSRADARDLLNLKIKRREKFRPFAPSILREFAGDYFEQVADVPFMEKVYKIKENKRAKIPAVTHVDGTGRLQTVTKEGAPKYYDLIQAFYKKSNIPLLLNTSFNENEPIVNSPQEALDCFLRTKMDMLVMEDIVVRR